MEDSFGSRLCYQSINQSQDQLMLNSLSIENVRQLTDTM